MRESAEDREGIIFTPYVLVCPLPSELATDVMAETCYRV